ncbi:flagellar biosynthesis protein FlgL [Porphyrobacter sp. TH134]|uniref:flagellin N-terminal helical domain-containing protein n=1 Tax=Porphyrobacter sp. TH134 TaxID=2067450 RepID=UPI000C7E51A5|nr:flagellar biosynthesis protein FlgL [Porphyrobacter sp. TH134]PLK24166.1 flagellar biosynthesis protein FlgL [Porphyrobacter sp. TH134]
MGSITNSAGSFFNRSLAQMGDLRAGIERTRTQIATGRKIERGSQDPAAAAQLRSVARREALARVESDNAARLGQDLGAAATEIEAVTALLQRARELALQAANTPTGVDGRRAIAFELEQLGQQLFSRANATSLTGEPLFAGQSSGAAFTQDALGNVTYAGTPTSGAVPVAPGTAIERGLPGDAVFQFDLGGTPTSAFAVLGGLVAALQGGVPDPVGAANAALEGIDAALDTTNRATTILGTRMAWVDQLQDQQGERGIALAERRSRVGDTDIADAIARLQQSMTALEASQSAFARVSSLTLFDALR